MAALLARATAAFEDAEAALRAGDLAGYQAKNKEGVALIGEAQRAVVAAGGSGGSGEGGGGDGASTTTTAPTTTTEQPASA